MDLLSARALLGSSLRPFSFTVLSGLVWWALGRVDLVSGFWQSMVLTKNRRVWHIIGCKRHERRERIKTCWVGLGAVQACLSAAQSGQEHIIGVLGRSARSFTLGWKKFSSSSRNRALHCLQLSMQSSQKCFVKFKPTAQESYKRPPECLHLSSQFQGMRSYLEPKTHLWTI